MTNDAALRFGRDPKALRSEDEPLLTGRGRFTDDIVRTDALHAVFVRSPVAHARVRGIDVEAARAMAGVAAVFTGEDLAGLGPIPMAMRFANRDGSPMTLAPLPVLPAERVRYVGEAVAMVVATSPVAAQDAADLVDLDLEELPAAATVEAALAAPVPIWDDAPGNVALDWSDGDEAAVDAAFADAAHVVAVRLVDTRVAPTAMEPRAAIAEWDAATGRFTLTAGTQGVVLVRRMLAEHVFRVPQSAIRVLTHDVGGGFGMKVQPYAEYAAILYAARALGRPVRWRASRTESFLTDTHGRDGVLEAELALAADGRFLALRARNAVGIGAYVSTFAPVFSTNNTKNCLASVYRTPLIHTQVRMVLTNAVPLGPYRGAGRPEAIYAIERLIDEAAHRTGIDRVELRRRNMIPPSAMPYAAPNGQVYDSGAFEAAMDRALLLADWQGFPRRRADAAARGRLRGIGLCSFLEVAGGILDESADLRFDADGGVALRLGVQAIGQGHLTTFTRLVADRLGIDPAAVRLVEGDSDEAPQGWPTVASRSAMMAGSAAVVACDAAIEKGRRIAAHLLEAGAHDIAFDAGSFRVVGTDRHVPLLELARIARTRTDLPADLQDGLDATEQFVSSGMSFPNGCHVAEVEIDPETGHLQVVGYVAVDDVGVMLNEPIVEGQLHGGIAQGLGQVLGEHVVYDANGQMLTASFMDYPMPRAHDLPSFETAHHGVRCTTNPLGAKGAGESGVAGALPAAMNAVFDALHSAGVERFDLPATPYRIWQALRAA